MARISEAQIYAILQLADRLHDNYVWAKDTSSKAEIEALDILHYFDFDFLPRMGLKVSNGTIQREK